ncbi:MULTISPECIES: alcohol dehydrogenase [Eisenbergiella]|uniref:alcohol dehydrogenase n=1 Tax=Eisenbergiella TaxID=1432051 RepID=UPI0023EFAB01|nr:MULTISPECIES: alcohol dehydrogenase [Eisenbergiella]MCI6708826.1 alcohol dehydrogenase [Eisenbergiella massiliensis]MDY5525045.1 alcohol dehydrogenase [Eisenbergiella porci]
MKAVIYKEKGVFSLEKRPRPSLRDPKDAIVRIALCSICSSDIHIKHGSVPRAVPGTIVGHEMVGEVVETGSAVTKYRPGDRVAVNVETFCGECFFCQRGFVNNCTDEHGGWALGCRIDGGQAEYVRVPFADNGLNLIPEGVSDEQALFTGDILSTGYWAAQISEIKKGDTVLVLGAGPTGLCTLMCAALYEPGAIICADISEERLELVRSRKLADRVINPRKEDAAEAVRAMTEGRGADVVIEAVGGEDTFRMAWEAARPNGTVCIVAMYEEAQPLPLPDMYGKNLTFKTGGVDANACDEILRLIAEGRLDTTCMITHRFTLDQVMEAYDIFENKKEHVMKIAVRP